MKEIQTGNYKYTQTEVIIGSKKRSVIMVDKKPITKLEQKKINNTIKSVTIKTKGCSGCSRKKRG